MPSFIFLLTVIGLAWLLLRFKMPDHENLQAYSTVIVVWGLFFFGILAIPDYVPYPWNLYVCGIDTLGAIVFSIAYFGYLKRPKPPVVTEPRKLEALSPIHSMILAIERVSPKASSFGPNSGIGIGRAVWFDTPNLNLDKVRSIFAEHADILGDHHVKKWLDFDAGLSEWRDRGAWFWVGKKEWNWLLELEREYQDALNASRPQIAPEIEVTISPPFVCHPSQLEYLLHKGVERLAYRGQCLRIKATTSKVVSLEAKTWIDGKGPYFLNWAPKASDPTSQNHKRIDLFREEEVELPIWYAPKQLFGPEKGFQFLLTIPSDDGLLEFEMGDIGKPTIHIEIQFIAENYTDAERRKFMLEDRPWDELCLTAA